jgi:uncharacterized membrane protein YgcG
MKRVKLMLMTLCVMIGLTQLQAQSQNFVTPTEAVTILYQQRTTLENTIESLLKQKQNYQVGVVKLKQQYYLMLHEAIRQADDVYAGIENTVIPTGAEDLTDATPNLSKADVMAIKEEAIKLLTK